MHINKELAAGGWDANYHNKKANGQKKDGRGVEEQSVEVWKNFEPKGRAIV